MSTAMREQVKSAIDSTADQAKKATDWLGDHTDAAIHTAGDFAQRAEDRAKCAANRVANKVSHAAEPVKNIVQDGYQQGKMAANHLSEDAVVLIRKHPLAAVAVGFAMGLLIGRVAAIRV